MGSTHGSSNHRLGTPRTPARPLYTAQERARRDASGWTLVQGILAPVQFVVFLVSLGLVLRYLANGEGLAAATWSVVIKTLTLYLIMVTGCIWEKVVFGRYLFAPAFYWEDVFSMLVLALHTAYLVALLANWLAPQALMLLALAAYAAYLINATQFILKLRAARLGASAQGSGDVVAELAARAGRRAAPKPARIPVVNKGDHFVARGERSTYPSSEGLS